jgi:hypothetical protein
MGETNEATEYDPVNLFKHLFVPSAHSLRFGRLTSNRVFYLDSPSCAKKNGMRVSTRSEQAIETRLARSISYTTTTNH